MDNLFLVRCREIECFIDLLGHVAGEYNVLYFLDCWISANQRARNISVI